MKIGSLFDGSGGFPLAATMCGIEPVWASEIEPYPIAVTRSRFPNMKHLGDISKIHGGEDEPVDIITFGSPCQDLSVAGKRAGLKHEDNGDDETTRSGLFMEAVRIIKEMRNATNGKYPRYAIWENVPGAFSSNKGQDFRIVLEELVRIAEPTAVMPPVPKAGWAYADVYCGDGWSLAYRVLDAQHWGVPQRRRRIYLVADFGGQRAGKILFEREGLRGDFAESGAQREAVAGDAEGGTGAADCGGERVTYALDQQGGKGGANYAENVMPTLCSDSHGTPHAEAYSIENHPADSRVNIDDSGKVQTLTSRMGTGGGNVPMVMEQVPFCKSARARSADDATTWKEGVVANTLNTFDLGEVRTNELVVEGTPVYCLQGNGIDRADTAGCNGKGVREDVCYTLNTIDRPAVCYAMQGFGDYKESDVASGIKARDYKDATDLICVADHVTPKIDENGIAYTLNARDYKAPLCAAYGVDCRNATEHHEMTGALQADAAHNLNSNNVVRVRYIVRRLTPTECARLQGFPDAWGHPDSKKKLMDDEYRFWLDVRNTHAAINGKVVKDYTKAQMLTWYNKLHTDSSEYKMWGNGIALPCALYVMQGVAEALYEPRN